MQSQSEAVREEVLVATEQLLQHAQRNHLEAVHNHRRAHATLVKTKAAAPRVTRKKSARS